MKLIGSILATLLLSGIAFAADGTKNRHNKERLEIRFQPDSVVYVYENRGMGTAGDLYSAVIQNIGIVNHSNETLAIEELTIEASKNGKVIQRVSVGHDILQQSAQKYKAYETQGVLQFYDFQFQTSRYLKDIALAESTSLPKGHALILTHRALLFQVLPDLVTVRVEASSPNQKSFVGEASLKVVNHVSKNKYSLPLKGMWSALGAPSFISHHRWGTIQEFAFDFVKIGTNGLSYREDGSNLSHYYSYGEPIYAIGNGKVVSTYLEAKESNQNLKQPNESAEKYAKRMAINQQKLLAEGFSQAMGNHVIIEHENGEYSHYLHLKTNSLKVKVGDLVQRGEQIASLGHSGNSTEPHLHFHLTDGPDMAYSRSVPVVFDNITLYPDDDGTIKHLHFGQIIHTNE